MAGKMLGIEIGAETIKFAEVKGGTLTSTASYPLPDGVVRDGRVSSVDAIVEVLKNAKKELGLKNGPCALVIPAQATVSHQITMPVMSEQDVALNLPYEFRDYIGNEAAKYLFDYSVLSITPGANGKAGTMELIACAVEKELMDESYDFLKKAGFTMQIAVPVEMAWANLLRNSTNLPSEVCIVDAGATHTNVEIYKDGKPVMGKDIELGGATIDQVIAAEFKLDAKQAHNYKEADHEQYLPCAAENYNDLAVEIMRVCNFYNRGSEGKLRDIYLCGGAMTEYLRTAILKTTDMQLHHIYRLVPGGDENASTARCALAAGAAMQ